MTPQALRARLPRTWGAFFAQHGRFTPIQEAAVPLLLRGENVLLSAGTASGKTEAVLAPLIERHLTPPPAPARLTLLYLLPTRALVNDLAKRMAVPAERLRVSYAVKTRDLNTFVPQRSAHILFTTPESLDSLLANHAKTLIHVQAVVIDELHVFDGTVRGDQLRVLLNRLRQIRTQSVVRGDAAESHVQYAALSATLAQPLASAARYFPDAHVVHRPDSRAVQADLLGLEADSASAFMALLQTFRQRGWRKALVFCNTRADVEAYAALVRAGPSPFGEAVFVHYSNLAPERRREIEAQFGEASAAICLASSTLELGIDIGTIDVAIMIGPPGQRAAFMQRAGRASRRTSTARIICFYRTPLEKIIFEALLTADYALPGGAFRPSVAIQQIFSLLKQSPTAALRFGPLMTLFDGLLPEADLRLILGALQARDYLTSGRDGEWRAGPHLKQLIDSQAYETTALSLYSNLEVSDAPHIKIRDYNTQRLIAHVDRRWLDQDGVTLEGRSMSVSWVDDEGLWLSPSAVSPSAMRPVYGRGRQRLSFEVAQRIAHQAGFLPHEMPVIAYEGGWLAFHWLGDVYGRLFYDLLSPEIPVSPSCAAGLCFLWLNKRHALPVWTEQAVLRHVHDHYRRYEALFPLGAYHALVPPELRGRTITGQFEVSRFVKVVNALQPIHNPENATETLLALVQG